MSGDGKSHGNKFLIPLRGYSHGPTAKIGNTRHKEKRDGLRTLRRSVNVRTKEGSAETSLRGLGLTCSKVYTTVTTGGKKRNKHWHTVLDGATAQLRVPVSY